MPLTGWSYGNRKGMSPGMGAAGAMPVLRSMKRADAAGCTTRSLGASGQPLGHCPRCTRHCPRAVVPAPEPRPPNGQCAAYQVKSWSPLSLVTSPRFLTLLMSLKRNAWNTLVRLTFGRVQEGIRLFFHIRCMLLMHEPEVEPTRVC